MNLSNLKIFIFILTLFSACSPTKKDSNELLRLEVIAVHDEVMPKMDELKKLKKEINQKSEELQANNSATPEDIARLSETAIALDSAFEEMFIWMRQFKSNNDDLTDDEIEAYLLEQRVKVQKVNDDIKSAIINAKKELGKS